MNGKTLCLLIFVHFDFTTTATIFTLTVVFLLSFDSTSVTSVHFQVIFLLYQG
jgi:hypothetical protein